MRIAFTGSHSTGKTTLIDGYVAANADTHIQVIRGIARGVISRGFNLGKQSTIDGWTNYIGDQLRAERIAASAKQGMLLSDRTVLDAVAYAKTNRALLNSATPQYFIDMLLEIALREALFYDLYVFCPVEFPMLADGIRDEDESYRRHVGDVILALLNDHHIPHVVLSGDANSRLRAFAVAVAGDKA